MSEPIVRHVTTYWGYNYRIVDKCVIAFLQKYAFYDKIHEIVSTNF